MKKLISGFVLLGIFLITACESPYAGLGRELDLQGPEVAITSHKNMDYVGPHFTLEGTASDNFEVTNVQVEIKSVGFSTKAVLNGNAWSAEISNLVDGEYLIQVTASDAAKNASLKSVTSLTLIVDATSPTAVVSSPSLKPLDYLQTLWADGRDFETIDYFQNGVFFLRGASEENFKLKSVQVELLKESEIIFNKVILNGNPLPAGASGTIWNWTLAVDTQQLIYQGILLNPQEKHYLKVRVTIIDQNENTTILEPETVADPGYIIVYPEADKPWLQIASHLEGETVQPGAQVSGNAWDDDGLRAVYAQILPFGSPVPGPQGYKSWVNTTTSSGVTRVYTGFSGNPRMYSWNIPAPLDPGKYTLYLQTTDNSGLSAPDYTILNIIVPDQDFPLTVVTAPETQSVYPTSGKGSLTLTGYSYDNVLVTDLKLAWVPKGQDLTGLLKGELWSLTSPSGVYQNTSSGIKIWDLTEALTLSTFNPNLPYEGAGGRYERTWSKSLDIESDLRIAGVTEYADRNFILYTKDSTNNVTYARITLLGEQEAPILGVTTPATNGEYKRSVPDNYFSLGGSVADNSSIKSVVVKWVEGNVTLTAILSGTSWSLSTQGFAVAPEKSKEFSGATNFQITATDVYGNKGFAQCYVLVDNDKPTVTQVTSTNPNGYYGPGQQVEIYVDFAKPVVVAGSPTILLNSGASATYQAGSGSGSLKFIYTVGPGQNAQKLDYASTGALNLNGGTLVDLVGNPGVLTLPTPGTTGSLSGTKFLTVDTTPGTVVGLSSNALNGYYSAGKSIPLQVTFDEIVTVSGIPEILLNAGGTPESTAFYSSGTGSKILTFNYLVASGHNAGDLNFKSVNSLSGMVMDLAGNPTNLTLPLGNSLSVNKDIIVDTTPPTPPGLSGITQGNKNTPQSFSLTGVESGASLVQYSLNGGLSWNNYTGAVTLSTDGIYIITTKQSDAAGNPSAQGAPLNLSIDTELPLAPNVVGITSGNFAEVQSFKLYGEAGGVLEYSLDNGSSWVAYTSGTTIFLNPAAGSQKLYEVKARQTDAFGNGPVETLAPVAVLVDKKVPGIVAYSPFNGAKDVNQSSSITLTFDEPVFREYGKITFRRLYNRFPVVMSSSQRNEYRSQISGANLSLFDASYTLTSHGAPGGVPSSTGVFVLNYDLEPTNSDLLGLFDTLGYNKIIIPVDSTQVTGTGTTTIIINPAEDLPQGIDWYLEIDATCFRDGVGNKFPGLSGSAAYGFVTGPVATPIIRINKVTGNGNDGDGTQDSGATQPKQTAFKISSETQGAEIRYTSNAVSSASWNPSIPTSPADPLGSSTLYSGPVVIGTNSSTVGHIEWIKAKGFFTGRNASGVAEELAFKTVLSVNHGNNNPTYTIYFRGSDNAGGPTTAPGFPLAWETNQFNKIRRGEFDGTRYYLISWEINVDTQYKAIRGDIPADWATKGPTKFGWQAGDNLNVKAGGYKNVDWSWYAGGENYDAHTVR